MHLENFGGYDAAEGREHFDVTDFDEAALAPVTWELTRLCVSLLLAANSIGMERRGGEALVQRCIDAYAAALAGGTAAVIDNKTSQPDLRKFLHRLSSNHPDAFLKARTTGKGDRRRLRIIKNKTLAAKPVQVKSLRRWWNTNRNALGLREFGQLLDIARRVTGTGSLGVHRYALLADVKIGKDSFILRELHPGDDKLTVSPGKAQRERLVRLSPWLGRVTAASHQRTAGWKGASAAAELTRFAKAKAWPEHVSGYARRYAKVVERDWRLFRKATRTKSKT